MRNQKIFEYGEYEICIIYKDHKTLFVWGNSYKPMVPKGFKIDYEKIKNNPELLYITTYHSDKFQWCFYAPIISE